MTKQQLIEKIEKFILDAFAQKYGFKSIDELNKFLSIFKELQKHIPDSWKKTKIEEIPNTTDDEEEITIDIEEVENTKEDENIIDETAQKIEEIFNKDF